MTPAPTGPAWRPIRTRQGGPAASTEGQVRGRPDVIRRRPGQTRGRHVGIADCLDLLDAELVARGVERREHRVQGRDDGRRLEAPREFREADEVAEDDGHVVVPIGDEALAGVEPVDDRLGQHVQEEAVGLRPLGLELAHEPVHEPRVRVPDLLDVLEHALEARDSLREARVVLADRLGGEGRLRRDARAGLVGHVPSRSVTNVSWRKRLVSAPLIGPTSP